MPHGYSFDLEGRTALVTGASSGLGRRFASLLADAGANVVVGARRADRLRDLTDEIRDNGGRALAVEMDVSSEESVQAGYDAAEAEFGTVDSVIANAGINSQGMATDLPADEFDRVMATNLRGVFLTVREGAKRLLAQHEGRGNEGRVVIVSSITAHTAAPGLAAYSASKAAVLQMGKVLAREWIRQRINVNVICPGYIATELNSDWFETDAGQRLIAKFPRRRLMQEDGLDALLLFLASDASSAITGAAFTADDGQSL